MKRAGIVVGLLGVLGVSVLHACSTDPSLPRTEATDPKPAIDVALTTTRLFPTEANPGVERPECIFSSPVAWNDQVLVTEGSGTVTAYDGETGAARWQVEMPAPAGEQSFVTAAPALLADAKLLVVAYHTTAPGTGRSVSNGRLHHRVAVVDLAAQRLDPRFAVFDLHATLPGNGGNVSFLPSNALARGTVVVGRKAGDALGRAYVTFGNVRDIQPWHGWIFEVDLDAWSNGKEPISAARVTTPEPDCGAAGASGSRQRVCGGGLWAPAGPLLRTRGDDYDLILSTGNGQLDITRGDYANTLMRTGRALAFDPGCDAARCAGQDPHAPTEACVSSCKDLFVPRIPAGGAAFVPESGICDDSTSFFDCWARLDYVGGSTPALAKLPSGREVLVYPSKDGHAYLVDGANLGTLLDRRKLVENCGTKSDPCTADWAGMAVTQPEVLDMPDGPLVFVPTFMFDQSHPAGVVALKVRETADGARLETAWTFPDFASPDAARVFRRHPTRARLVRDGLRGEPTLWVGEMLDKQPGVLWGVRATDGKLVARQTLAGPGFRFAQPLVVVDKVFLPSCGSDSGPGRLEGYRVTAP